MDEILDIYDQNKNKTEKKYIRGSNILKKDEYVIVVEIAICSSDGKILLSKRSERKKNNPLKWETTQGSVKSGEDSESAAVREISEELGITISKNKLNKITTIRDSKEHIFKDIFLVKQDILIDSLKFTDGEVSDAKWVGLNELEKMNELKLLSSNMNFNKSILEK